MTQWEYGVGRTWCRTYIQNVRPTPLYLNFKTTWEKCLVVGTFLVTNLHCILVYMILLPLDLLENLKIVVFGVGRTFVKYPILCKLSCKKESLILKVVLNIKNFTHWTNKKINIE